jgi:hypothetical protein
VVVADRDRKRVAEHPFRVREADAVFPEVRPRFRRIPDRHICIIYAYGCPGGRPGAPDLAAASVRVSPRSATSSGSWTPDDVEASAQSIPTTRYRRGWPPGGEVIAIEDAKGPYANPIADWTPHKHQP